MKRSGGATAATVLAYHGMKVSVYAQGSVLVQHTIISYHEHTETKTVQAIDDGSDKGILDGSDQAQFINETHTKFPANGGAGGDKSGEHNSKFSYMPASEEKYMTGETCSHDHPTNDSDEFTQPNENITMKILITTSRYWDKRPK